MQRGQSGEITGYPITWFSDQGARWRFDDQDEDRAPDFDYLTTARQMARERHERLLNDPAVLEGRTLLFELIHPQARIVTNYGDRAELIFIACFDHRRFAYVDYDEVRRLGAAFGLKTAMSATRAKKPSRREAPS